MLLGCLREQLAVTERCLAFFHRSYLSSEMGEESGTRDREKKGEGLVSLSSSLFDLGLICPPLGSEERTGGQGHSPSMGLATGPAEYDSNLNRS